MDDLISRQAAIDGFYEMASDTEHLCTIKDYVNFLESMTAARPERNKGKWIDNKGLYQCSACKHIWSELWWSASCPIDRMIKIMRFCPNCGADMRILGD